MKNFTLKTFLVLFSFCSFLQAQDERRADNKTKEESTQIGLSEENQRSLEETGFVKCLTIENEKILQQKYPNRANENQFEAWMANKLEEVRQERLANPNAERQQVVVTIPVVVHVVHSGQAIGTAPNITDAQVISQITAMNEDFRKLSGTPGDGTGVDVEIEFCLAQQDPTGAPTNGIRRFDSSAIGTTWSGPGGSTDTVLKPATIWDPTQYMNMWSVQFSDPSLLGYAQFPNNSGLGGLNANNGGANSDGVVAAYSTFGDIGSTDGTFLLNAPYDRGRTMTHEVGHYLGLRHIWGDANCGNDFCADTPVQQTSSGGNCPATTTCDGVADLTTNYMDYSNDICMNNFTQNQKDRMLIVMANSPRRMELPSSTVCTPSTTPVINFAPSSPSPGDVAEGSDCNFTDYTIDLNCSTGGSAVATVTLVNSGTAVENEDFMLMNNSVTFPAGSITPSNAVTLRVFNDNFVEADETIVLGLNLSTTGDSTVAGATYTSTIINDDTAVTPTATATYYSDNFDDEDISDWSLTDADGDGNSFGDQFTLGPVASPALMSRSWIGAALTPDNWAVTPGFDLSSASGTITMSWTTQVAAADWDEEKYSVHVGTTNNIATLVTSSTSLTEVLGDAGNTGTVVSHTLDISALAGQSNVHIAFRHWDCTDEDFLAIDNLTVTGDVSVGVQDVVNTATGDQFNLPSAGLAYSVDDTTSNIMVDVNNTGGFDYGCTTVAVSRDVTTAGAAAVSYAGGTNVAGYVTAKTFDITTANTGTGAANIGFYFTEAELAAWEGITGENRNALYVKNDTTGEVVPVTISAFGTDSKLEATFANGLAGTYYFGTQLAFLSTGEFELASSISIYPNPTVSTLTISVANDNDLPNAYKIYNMLGQLITENTINSKQDLTIDATPFSNGMYFIKISKAGKALTLPFIKK